jgi:hypothetical protein
MIQASLPNPDEEHQNSPEQVGKNTLPHSSNLVPLPFKSLSTNATSIKPYTSRFLYWLLTYLKEITLTDPQDLYGKVKVTNDLKRHARFTASSITISNIINVIGLGPFIYLFFASFGIIWAWVFTLLLLGCIQRFSNVCGIVAANNRPELRSWSFSGQLGFILMSAFLTLFAGAGVVLFNDFSSVQEIKAQRLIAWKNDRIEALKHQSSPPLDKVRQEIERLSELQTKTPKDDPLWQTYQVRQYGLFSERNRDWTKLPLANRPLKQQEYALEQQQLQTYEQVNALWQTQLIQRAQSSSDMAFLKKTLPEVYHAHFLENGNLRSSAEAVAIANEIFLKQLFTLSGNSLGFALLFIGLSVITSGIACCKAITFAKRKDVQDSRDLHLKKLRDQAIQQLRRQTKREE